MSERIRVDMDLTEIELGLLESLEADAHRSRKNLVECVFKVLLRTYDEGGESFPMSDLGLVNKRKL